MSGELPYAPLLRACYRIVDAASYLDWGLTSDYDAGVTAQPHPQPHPQPHRVDRAHRLLLGARGTSGGALVAADVCVAGE